MQSDDLKGQHSAVKIISGPRLRRRLHRLSAIARADLANEIATGAICVRGMPRSCAAPLTRAKTSDVALVAKVHPENRHLAIAPVIDDLCAEPKPRPVSDGKIARFINEAGAARVLNAIDRLTAPKVQIVAE